MVCLEKLTEDLDFMYAAHTVSSTILMLVKILNIFLFQIETYGFYFWNVKLIFLSSLRKSFLGQIFLILVFNFAMATNRSISYEKFS